MGEVGPFILNDRLVSEYIALQPESFRVQRRHYALAKVLELFLRHSGFASIENAVKFYAENPRNGLAVALQKVVNDLEAGGAKPKTIIFYMHLLKKFLEFYDVPVDSAWRKLRKPKKAASRVDRVPSLAELQRLIMASRSPRMRLLLQLLAQTGMRIGEALSLRIDCIDLESRVIRIPGSITKTGMPREVPIPSELYEALQAYLRSRGVSSPYLFPSERDPSKPWSKIRVRLAYGELLRRLGMDARTPDGSAYTLHFHVFRKWYRTMLESAGVNKLLIDLWMGHNSGVEKRYYLPTPEMVRQEIEKADKALRIFGATIQPLAEEKIRALENALKFYEALVDQLAKKNPRLLKMLGLE